MKEMLGKKGKEEKNREIIEKIIELIRIKSKNTFESRKVPYQLQYKKVTLITRRAEFHGLARG
jgi:Txe/YoeB family toxin of Txe-Axe toxin-antitoxin module